MVSTTSPLTTQGMVIPRAHIVLRWSTYALRRRLCSQTHPVIVAGTAKGSHILPFLYNWEGRAIRGGTSGKCI